MRRLHVGQLTKSIAAYAIVSSGTIDAWLLLAQRWEVLDVRPGWYLEAPLVAVALAGIPASLGLAERLLTTAHKRARPIVAVDASATIMPRQIPYTKNGRQGTILANSARLFFGEVTRSRDTPTRRVLWRVPIQTREGENVFTVHEAELRNFLEIAYRRDRHQFSRRYWCKKRRPAMLRPKYEAFMRLLTESGLVEGRHEQGRASGRLTMFPREALMYLKYQSRFAITGPGGWD